ncbi:hypothetical protein O181_010177 [Austropuccinia psidii MF-1]|uniref:MATE efflux family protein n=1 Tax=Austropuccinia psidii MF-1 TaxID=1389203 RepID=A0A9Q3BT79_9BASI|nr:hypothetical protein [Austropuccinia psidii MF-1]
MSECPHESSIFLASDDTEAEGDSTKQFDWKWLVQEQWLAMKISFSIAFTYMLQNCLQVSSVILCGHLVGQDALSIAAISYMWATVTSGCLALGGSTALDTLASTTFTSSSNPHDMGVLLQRSIIILLLLNLPLLIFWWFIAPVLLFLGQDPLLAARTQEFLRILSFGSPGYLLFEIFKKFLQVQGILHASTVVLIFVSPIHVLLNWAFIYWLDYGAHGAAIGASITYWIAFLLILALVRFGDGYKAWGGLSKKCFDDFWKMTKLSLSGFVMVGTQCWALTIVTLTAGRISVLAMDTQSVIMTLAQISATIPFGISVAASSRMGNILGNGQIRFVKQVVISSLLLATLMGGVLGSILVATRKSFGYLFTRDEKIVAAVARVLPIAAAVQITDGWAQACAGILRGTGMQHFGAAMNIVAYYAMALPLGLALAFSAHMGLVGLWLAQCLASLFIAILEFGLICCLDWGKEVSKARKRVKTHS